MQGELINGRAHVYQQLYFSFYESTLTLYTNQYAMFGDPEVLPVKVIWDYTYYWGVLCQLFFQRRLTDLANLSRLSDHLNHSRALNVARTSCANGRSSALVAMTPCCWTRRRCRGLRS
jgi:hypothetical protein